MCPQCGANRPETLGKLSKDGGAPEMIFSCRMCGTLYIIETVET